MVRIRRRCSLERGAQRFVLLDRRLDLLRLVALAVRLLEAMAERLVDPRGVGDDVTVDERGIELPVGDVMLVGDGGKCSGERVVEARRFAHGRRARLGERERHGDRRRQHGERDEIARLHSLAAWTIFVQQKPHRVAAAMPGLPHAGHARIAMSARRLR